MKLKSLITEKRLSIDSDNSMLTRPMTSQELSNIADSVKNFKMYGQALQDETDLIDLSKTLSVMANGAGRVITSDKNIEDFDKASLMKDVKDLKQLATEFNKTAKEAMKLKQRMQRAYDEMGLKLNRYFDMD